MKRTFHVIGAVLATAAVAVALGFSWGAPAGHSQAQDFHFKAQSGLNFTKASSLNFT